MSEEMNIADMATAHQRLTESLLTMPSRKAYNKTLKAIEDLSIAISARACNALEDEDGEEPVQDWVQLDENVRNHCMGPQVQHKTDGRICWYHSRLDAWVFDVFTEEKAKKCLRGDHERITLRG